MPADRRLKGIVAAFACGVVIAAFAAPPALAQQADEPPDIRVTSATFGGNCGAAEGNLTWPLVQACDGEPVCRYQIGEDVVEALAAEPERCANRLTVQWRCGNRPETFADASPARATPPGVGAGYVLLFSCPPGAAAELEPPTATLQSVQKDDRPALPSEFSSVRIVRNGERLRTELGMNLRAGDELWTDDDTIAVLSYPEAAQVIVTPKSHIRISSVVADFGTLIVKIFSGFTGVFKVETEYVTAGAKGTEFKVVVEPAQERASVTVVEGYVELTSQTGSFEDHLVREGEEVVVEAREPPRLRVAAAAEIQNVALRARTVERLAYCKERAGAPVRNGEVLQQTARGPHEIRVSNGTERDAIVKLRDMSGNTVLAFYVAASASAKVSDVPNGTFRVAFLKGRQYSRECGRFLEDMEAKIFPDVERFDSQGGRYSRWVEFTLHPVAGGTIQLEDLDVEDFLD